jgi:hypothetical protein
MLLVVVGIVASANIFVDYNMMGNDITNVSYIQGSVANFTTYYGVSGFSGTVNYSQVLNHPSNCSGSNYFQVGSNNNSRICSPLNETAISRFDSYIVAGTANAWLIHYNNISGVPIPNIAGENITSGTVADARIASTIARDSEILMQVNQNVNTTGNPTFGGLSTGILNVTNTLNMTNKNITGVDYIIGKNGGKIIFN